MDSLQLLEQQAAEYVTGIRREGVELHLDGKPETVDDLARFLRHEPGLAFDYPADLTAYDTGEELGLWYRLVAMDRGETAILHVKLPREDPEVPSVTSIWPGMDWHERECYDLFGIRFIGHPDQSDPTLMRILLPEDWEGHPFRKDYEPVFSGDPLHGPQERN